MGCYGLGQQFSEPLENTLIVVISICIPSEQARRPRNWTGELGFGTVGNIYMEYKEEK